MKKRFKDEDKVGFFGRIKKKISDWFYDLSVRGADLRKKHMPQKEMTKKNRKLKRRLFYISIVTLPMIHWLIFYVVVNFNSILLALKIMQNGEYVWANQVGDNSLFKNFIDIFEITFKTASFKKTLFNSLLYYFIGLATGTVLSLFFSYYIYKQYYFTEFFRVILFLPSIISTVITAFLYLNMVDYGIPDLVQLCTGKELAPLTSNQEYRMMIVVVFNLIMSFGTSVLMYSSAMSRIPISVVEYASIDGVGALREFITITLPLIFSTFSTFFITGITGIFTNQQGLLELFGPYSEKTTSVATVGYYMFSITYQSEQGTKYPEAAALGLIFTAVAIPLTFFVRWVLGKIDPDVQY